MDSVVQLPANLRREFLAALQAVRPGSVEEELTEKVCLSLLKDRLNPNPRHIQSTGATGRPGTAGSNAPGGVSENEWKLMQRAKELEDELRLALCAAEDIRALKHKASLLMEDVRKGKEDLQSSANRGKKVLKERDMLSDHTEKLMKVIRQLMIDKAKSEERRKEERLMVFKLTQDNVNKESKLAAKRKALKSLQAINERMSKQLELMDSKFVDLRMRFDAAKHVQNTTLEKAVKESQDLRKRFNIMTRGRGRLDDVPLAPDASTPILAPNSTTLLHAGEQWMDASQGFFPKPGNNNQATDRVGSPVPGPKAQVRPATTGGINGKSQRRRPGTATPTRGGHGATSAPPAEGEDIDKIIEKIYSKQKRAGGKDETVWTPAKLKTLVQDAAGHTGCAIPDITAHLRSTSVSDGGVAKRAEPGYSKMTM